MFALFVAISRNQNVQLHTSAKSSFSTGRDFLETFGYVNTGGGCVST